MAPMADEAAPSRDHDPASYGDVFAEVYDSWYGDVTDADATARFVAERANGAPVLELGIGTGRLAKPLLALGLEVVGVDASVAMLARCAQRRLSPAPSLLLADMAALPIRRTGRGPSRGRQPIGAVLLGFNTLFNLPTADAQRALFAELGAVLDPGAVVVVEALDPQVLAGASGQAVGVASAPGGEPSFVATDVDPEAQTITGRHLRISDDGVRVLPWYLRWSTPAEIDLFAAGAGLVMTERFGSWDETPHGPDSEVHISVYRR